MEKKNSYLLQIILALISAGALITVALINHPWHKDIPTTKERDREQYFLSGTIVDASSNNSIPQAEIIIVGRNEEYVSESNGNFRLPFKDSIGHVRIRVTKNDYSPYDKSYDLPLSDIIIQLKHK